MTGARRGRRAFLTAAAAVGTAVASIGRASATDTDGLENACSRDDGNGDGTFPIDIPPDEPDDAPEAPDPPEPPATIDVTVSDSGTAGPTAFIVGGMHGDEEAGILAAHNITGWEPTAGQLVVLPEANPGAIEQHTRETALGDLNRQFDYGQKPATALAQAIWQAVTAAEPDVLIALHESTGIYEGTPPGVGQAIFRSPGDDTDDAASMGIRRANRTIGSQELKFDIGPVTGPKTAPTGLLTEKAAYQAGIPSFIVETYEEVNLEARVQWQEKCARGVLDYYDLF
jgi:predicted deacylase